MNRMTFDDFQHEAELDYLRELARLRLNWYKLANIFDKTKTEPTLEDDESYFEIPAFIREQVEQEQEVEF